MPIDRVQRRPEVFDCLEGEGYAWHRLRDQGGTYAYMAIRKRGPFADLHIEMVRWGHSVLKHMKLIDLPMLKQMCRENNVQAVIAQKTGLDPVWPKFIRQFGFSEPETIRMARLEID